MKHSVLYYSHIQLLIKFLFDVYFYNEHHKPKQFEIRFL